MSQKRNSVAAALTARMAATLGRELAEAVAAVVIGIDELRKFHVKGRLSLV